MRKRLIWNFELETSAPSSYFIPPIAPTKTLRWESRCFWPEEEIIALNGLDESFLLLSNYRIKHRQDTYFLLPDLDFNLKERKAKLVYKPLVQKKACQLAFAEKINLETVADETMLPGTPAIEAAKLRERLQNAQKITVTKETLRHTPAEDPKFKLELSRLTCNGRVYFTASVEGHDFKQVAHAGQVLFADYPRMDYIQFLRQQVAND